MTYLEAAVDCCPVWALHKKSTRPGKRALYLPQHMRTENAAGHINKQCCAHQASRHHSRPQQCTLGRCRMGKNRILAFESQGSHQRSGFNEPRLSHLHIHRKVLNSFVSDVCFSLINSHLLMFPLPSLHCQNKPGVYNWLLPHLFGAVPRGT